MYYFPCKIFRKGQTDSFKAGLCVIMEPLLIPTGHPRFARNASALASSSLYTMMLMLFMMGIETRSCEASGNLDWAALQEFGLTLIGFHYHNHPHHPHHPNIIMLIIFTIVECTTENCYTFAIVLYR